MQGVKWLKVKYEYEYGIDVSLDKKITEFFEGLGFRRWASGTEIGTRIRDLCFDGPGRFDADKDKASIGQDPV